MVLIASGKPFNPSIQAIRISLTPLLFKSVNTDNQKLEPSDSDKYNPKTSFSLPD